MKEKIVLKKRSTPKIVTLPNGTTFTEKDERISRKQLPSNIREKKSTNSWTEKQKPQNTFCR